MDNIFKKTSWLLLLGVAGCFGSNIPVISQSVEIICDDFIIRDECSRLADAEQNPVGILDGDTVFVTVAINACTELNVDSVKRKSDKIVIDLSEKGMECTGGGDLVEMKLELGQAVSLDSLEVYKDNELVFPIN